MIACSPLVGFLGCAVFLYTDCISKMAGLSRTEQEKVDEMTMKITVSTFSFGGLSLYAKALCQYTGKSTKCVHCHGRLLKSVRPCCTADFVLCAVRAESQRCWVRLHLVSSPETLPTAAADAAPNNFGESHTCMTAAMMLGGQQFLEGWRPFQSPFLCRL